MSDATQLQLDALEDKIARLREGNKDPDELHRLELKRERLQKAQYLAALRRAKR